MFERYTKYKSSSLSFERVIYRPVAIFLVVLSFILALYQFLSLDPNYQAFQFIMLSLGGVVAVLLRQKEILRDDFFNRFKQLKQSHKRQVTNYQNKVNRYDRLSKAHEISIKARRDLESQLGNAVTASIIEIKDIIQIVTNAQEAAINRDRQIKLLEAVNERLVHLSRLSIACNKNECVELKELIDDSVKIYADQIQKLGLGVSIVIRRNVKAFFFDALLLRQLFTNLLRESISSSRPNGNITITASQQLDENVVITIRDDGFGIFEKDIEAYIEEDHEFPTSPLELDLNTIEEIVKTIDGALHTEHVIGRGKTITLMFRCRTQKSKKGAIETVDNILAFPPGQPKIDIDEW
jgi:signal transduction histidine kinase